MYAILHGNPIDGLIIIGMFDSQETATYYADENLNGVGDWWIVEIEAPKSGQEQDG